MVTFLVPVDGSEPALRAVRHVAVRARESGAEVHLINVQPALPQAVTTFVPSDAVRAYHQEEGAKALAPAEAVLKAAGVKFHSRIAVGEAGQTVAAYARETGCDEIVMGVRGLGAVLNLLLGSTTTKVLSLTDRPVTLIK